MYSYLPKRLLLTGDQMVRPRHSFEVGYEDVAKVCGVTRNAVSKAVARELLDMEDLMSIITYCAAHATDSQRLEIMQALVRSGDYTYRGANRKGTASK